MIGLVKPHHYSPDLMAMGDCRVCGRIAEDPVHIKYQGMTVVVDPTVQDDTLELRGKTIVKMKLSNNAGTVDDA